MKEEVVKAMKSMKRGKAEGTDEIIIEMIEAARKYGIDIITEIANKIYNPGYIPCKLRESTFIPIPKKTETADCDKHRLISLISQLGKIILRINCLFVIIRKT